MKRTIRIAALAAAAVAGGAVVILQTVGSDAADKPLALPAVSAFAPGACRDAAPAVRTLANVTNRNEDAKTLSKAVRSELVAQGNKLVAVRPNADPAVAEKMTDVLARIGYVRIRTGKTYSPDLLQDLETARTALQTACTAG